MIVRRLTFAIIACILAASCVACGIGSSVSRPNPSPTATPLITNQEAEQAVVVYLQAQANTSYGEDLLAEFLNTWHSEGDYIDNEGNWVLRAGIYAAEAFNSSLLYHVFANPDNGSYVIEWWVSSNGSTVLTHNWNAQRLEDALHQE